MTIKFLSLCPLVKPGIKPVNLFSCKELKMSIAHSTFSCASACNGNKARETLRSCKCKCKLHGEWGWSPQDNEDVSLSASELDSASLHYSLAAKPPDWLKPANNEEVMSISTHCAIRGDWRKRASKDCRETPGYPLRRIPSGLMVRHKLMGIHNHECSRGWRSERPILAKKQGNACGAKGLYHSHVSIKERRPA
jgi:hypothetical protein